MPESQTIVRDTAGQFWRVSEYEHPNLSHLWEGIAVKRVKGAWVDKKAAHPTMVRKAGCEVVIVEGGDA